MRDASAAFRTNVGEEPAIRLNITGSPVRTVILPAPEQVLRAFEPRHNGFGVDAAEGARRRLLLLRGIRRLRRTAAMGDLERRDIARAPAVRHVPSAIGRQSDSWCGTPGVA